jgi:phosphoesterase RecJ-like protein
MSAGRVKVSFRSVGKVDVSALARSFGGGGHTKASGAAITGSLDEVQQAVLEASRHYLGTGELLVPSPAQPTGVA